MWQNSTLIGLSGPLPLSGNGPGIALLVVIAVFTFLALVAFALRMLAIYLRRRIAGMSDYLAFFGLIFCLAEAGVYSYAVVGAGFGRHMVELDAPTLSNFYKAALAAGFCWILATTFVKLSILCFYLELFTVNRKFVIACWSVFAGSVIFFIGFIIAVFTQCRPFSYYWMSPVVGLDTGDCSSPLPLLLASTVVNMVLDLAIFILPIPVLWKLNLPMRTKIEVNGVFAVAFLIFIMNMVRLIVASIKGVDDYTYNNIPQTMMVLMETQVGLISCCLPTLAPLWRRNGFIGRKERRRSKKSLSDDLTANDGNSPKPRGASVGGPNGDPNTFNSVGSEEKGLMTLSMILEESDMRNNRN